MSFPARVIVIDESHRITVSRIKIGERELVLVELNSPEGATVVSFNRANSLEVADCIRDVCVDAK